MNVVIIDDDVDFVYQLKDTFEKEFKPILKEINYDLLTTNFDHFKFNHYDIAFLDIDLKTANGINIGKKLNTLYPNIILIYVSMKSELVFETFTTKPYQFIRKDHYHSDLKIVFSQLKKTNLNSKVSYLMINKRQNLVHLSKIKYILSIGKEIIIKENQDLVLKGSIKQILKQLDYPYLIQIQRNTVLNFQYIEHIQENIVYTKDKNHFTIGKSYIKNFYKAYEEYLLQ